MPVSYVCKCYAYSKRSDTETLNTHLLHETDMLKSISISFTNIMPDSKYGIMLKQYTSGCSSHQWG
jgi:hypothetical protein